MGDIIVAVRHAHGIATYQNFRTAHTNVVGTGSRITDLRMVERVDTGKVSFQSRLVVDIVMHRIQRCRVGTEEPTELDILAISVNRNVRNLWRLVVNRHPANPLRTVEQRACSIRKPVITLRFDIIAVGIAVFKVTIRVMGLRDGRDRVQDHRQIIATEHLVCYIVPGLNIRPRQF